MANRTQCRRGGEGQAAGGRPLGSGQERESATTFSWPDVSRASSEVNFSAKEASYRRCMADRGCET
jgi:hypothetical protein